MITPHMLKTSNYKKKFCITYKNDKSIIKWKKSMAESMSIKDYKKSEDHLIKILSEPVNKNKPF